MRSPPVAKGGFNLFADTRAWEDSLSRVIPEVDTGALLTE